MPTGAKRAGISGLAVAIAATGGYLVYSGIRNVSPLAGLRDLARGKLPAGQAPVVTAVTFTEAMGPADPGAAGSGGGGVLGTARGGAIVTAARKYMGIRYRWGSANPSSGFDCSGLVTWVLHRDIGIDLSRWPGCNNTHTVSGQFYVTSGLRTVSRSS